jgi:hypothetical protein
VSAIVVKQTGNMMRAFDGTQVVATAQRCTDRDESGWPAGWTVTYSVPTREQALAILRNGGVR